MSNMDFNASSQSFNDLLGNGKRFFVPKYQRDYSWEEPQWDDLWQDILELSQGENNDTYHYMGYLAFEPKGDKKFLIIDGQQRITTISIIILAALKAIQSMPPIKDLEKRLEKIRDKFIGEYNINTTDIDRKLHLNKHNDKFFSDYLVPLIDAPKRIQTVSNKLLRDAFNWYYKAICDELKNGEDVVRFVDFLADRLIFTVITVSDEVNAYTVFETLNARGIQLSPSDLLKNYLLSLCDDSEEILAKAESLWDDIIDRLYDLKLVEYISVYWNSRNKYTRKNSLFKAIKTNIKTCKQAIDFLTELKYKSDSYTILKKPIGSELNVDTQKCIRELQMFGVSQPYLILLQAYDRYSESEFLSILKACCKLAFRYHTICKLNPNSIEPGFNDICLKMVAGVTSRDVVEMIKNLSPKDDVFVGSFATISLKYQGKNKNIIRYILFELEKQKSNNAYSIESDKYSVEHIYPRNSEDGWDEFEPLSDPERKEYSGMLGNLCLLDRSINKDLGNKKFAEKLVAYGQSDFVTTREVEQNYETWTPEKIEARQREMAKAAKTIWNL